MKLISKYKPFVSVLNLFQYKKKLFMKLSPRPYLDFNRNCLVFRNISINELILHEFNFFLLIYLFKILINIIPFSLFKFKMVLVYSRIHESILDESS